VDGLCDSQQESFKFRLRIPADSDGLLTIKAIDAHGNIGVYRYPFS